MSPASTTWSWGSPAWVIQARPVTTSTGTAVGLAHKVWAGIWRRVGDGKGQEVAAVKSMIAEAYPDHASLPSHRSRTWLLIQMGKWWPVSQGTGRICTLIFRAYL